MRTPTLSPAAFIARWQAAGGAERANYAVFLAELCDILDVDRPDPATGGLGDYRFERAVTRQEADGSTSNRRIDLYRRDGFILEAKQGHETPELPNIFTDKAEAERRTLIRRSRGWAQAMLKARGQALDYARDLPAEEGWPPFLIVCDVGFCFDLYADFSRTGKHYAQFPDSQRFRIYLEDLADPAIRDRLRAVWLDPLSLDPAAERQRVTRDIAALLAKLAAELERKKHTPEAVATFLMRVVFAAFAQSVNLLPAKDTFTTLLEDCRDNLAGFVPLVGEFWQRMNDGGFSTSARVPLKRFNGGLFAPGPHGAAEPLPIDRDMLELLIIATRRDWSAVDPAIFGTLLENAIDARERGRLGAHFTPRAFVERLVTPVLLEPLLAEWDGVKAAAVARAEPGVKSRAEAGDRTGAADVVRAFHARLCAIRVLDPACGTGNFLYVALDLLKRLEGEVLDLLNDLAGGEGDRFDLVQASVDPHQFLGLEKNPRAVPVAELVLWLGWLQWHFRERPGRDLPEPILRDFDNISERDALLDYKRAEPVPGLTRWGGRTKLHPITGEAVPDETDRVLVLRPVNPKPTSWPAADFIIGNPPFIAGKDLRAELGDGYAEALWATYPKVNKSADIALHFWWRAAQLLAAGKIERFGFITSNSLRQVFCRRVVAEALTAKAPIHLVFAIPDHPWTAGEGSAAVRIAMTAAARGPADGKGVLFRAVSEAGGSDGVPLVVLVQAEGVINADLTIGVDVKAARPLRANERIASPGVKLHGAGFIVTPARARALGLGTVPGLGAHIRPYVHGRDIMQRKRGLMVIDLDGLPIEEVRQRFPAVFQHVLEHVKPERDQNNEAYRRDNWWLFGRNNALMRSAIANLPRYIATVETAKHRVFVFLDAEVLPDNKLIVVGTDNAFHLGVLESRTHVEWMLAQGNWLGVGNDPVYAKTQAFDPFPFPDAPASLRQEIAAIAEELDAHRKTRLQAHDHLTLTGLYNALAAYREGRPLTPAERDTHEAGQIAILALLHDGLDAAVAAAYGWPNNLTAAETVARIVALNAERVAEEAAGNIRWLRPEFQAPLAKVQTRLIGEDAAPAPGAIAAWPAEEAAQYLALRQALRTGPATARDLALRLKGAPKRGDRLPRMLATLVALGQARPLGDNRFTA